jgi:hypothetical protein
VKSVIRCPEVKEWPHKKRRFEVSETEAKILEKRLHHSLRLSG